MARVTKTLDIAYHGERRPDAIVPVEVNGHRVITYSFGSSEETLLCLSGGPGLSCDYVRDSHCELTNAGFRVVCYDQLGTGASDRPDDPRLWTIGRFVEELETVRRTLKLGRVHLLGQSWGSWLCTEYMLTYPKAAKTYVIANGTGDIPFHMQELDRLAAALGPETVAMMARHQADGSIDHPEYQAAITILNYRHVCRLMEWPASLKRSFAAINMQIYQTMWGPNEFTCTGNLRDWHRLPDLHRIKQPCLIIVGFHDELTSRSAALMQQRLPNSELKVFPNSSHTPFFEEPRAYFETVIDFLNRHRSSPRSSVPVRAARRSRAP
jgi:proline iminopeptidase